MVYPVDLEEDLSSDWTENFYADAERLSFERRSDLLSLQKQKQSAMQSITASERAHYPVLSSNANLTFGKTDDTVATLGRPG